MNKLKSRVFLVMLAGVLFLTATGRAQNNPVVYAPPPPATKLEMLEANPGRLLVKASGLIGTTSAKGTVSVTCKEDTDAANGSKYYGLAIGLVSAETVKAGVRVIVDDDEVGPLLNAVDYLAKIDWSVTSLPSFNATFQTRSGFRIAVFGVKSTSSIEYSVRGGGMSKGIVLGPTQWAEFRTLIDQARRKLDDLRPK